MTKRTEESEQDVTILSLADSLCFRLLQKGFKVQRYNSAKNNSVYIKIDYGAGNSIRISSHAGKKHLNYRYNVDVKTTGIREERAGKLTRCFYGLDSIDRLISDITFQKSQKVLKYGQLGYARFMEQNRIEHCQDIKGFWQSSYELILDSNGNMVQA